MKKTVLVIILAVPLVFLGNVSQAAEPSKEKPGKALFNQHCAVCHPNGGNIISPAFTLHKEQLKAHKITKPSDIIKKMRNPGPGMTKFDKSTIPDKDAREIAEYILKTLK